MTSECRQFNRKLSSRRLMWNDQDCLELIDLFRQKPELWDPDDPRYTHRLAKIAAWKYISSYFLCRMDEVRLRLESLRSKYRDERCKEASSTEAYKSNWFAYDSFHFIRYIKNKRRYSYDSDIDKISQKPVGNNRNAANMNSVRNGHISKHFGGQRNQFSSSRKSARRKTSRRKSSSSDEANDIHNNAIPALVHDECSTFADHLKMKLEKFDLQDRAIVMHEVNNIIFEAEMKKYGHGSNF